MKPKHGNKIVVVGLPVSSIDRLTYIQHPVLKAVQRHQIQVDMYLKQPKMQPKLLKI